MGGTIGERKARGERVSRRCCHARAGGHPRAACLSGHSITEVTAATFTATRFRSSELCEGIVRGFWRNLGRSHKEATMIELSKHAVGRCNQRGVRDDIIALIAANADREVHCGGGCVSLEIGQTGLAELRWRYGKLVDRARGLVVVVNDEGKVVTVLHARNQRAARRYRRGL